MVRLDGVAMAFWLTLSCHTVCFTTALSIWAVNVPTTRQMCSLCSQSGDYAFYHQRHPGRRRYILTRNRPTLWAMFLSIGNTNSDDTSPPTSKPTTKTGSYLATTTLTTSPSPKAVGVSEALGTVLTNDGTLVVPLSGSTAYSNSQNEYSAIVHHLFAGGENIATGSATASGPIYVFDGVCNFCNDSVQLCYDLDEAKVLRFCSMQSTTGRAILQHFGKAPDDWTSLVLVESEHTAHFQSDAVLQLARHLSGVPQMLRIMAAVAQTVLPERLRHAAYHVVADNRHVFGSSEGPTCRVDLDPSRFVDIDDMPGTIICSD